MATQLDRSIRTWIADTGIAHGVVHGGPTETVETEGGPVRTLAKLIADAQTQIDQATAILTSLELDTGAANVGSAGGLSVQEALDARPTSAVFATSIGAALVGWGHGEGTRTVEEGLDVLYRGVVNVCEKRFAGGAKGDGFTNDAPAIRAAIAALPETGGTLFFPASTLPYIQGDGTSPAYPLVDGKYSGPPDIGTDIRFSIVGKKNFRVSGYGATIQAHPNNSCIIRNAGFSFTNCKNVVVEGLTYDGRIDTRAPSGGDAQAWNSQNGFLIDACQGMTFRDVTSDRCVMDGFMVQSNTASLATWSAGIVLENCRARYSYRQGLSAVNVRGCRVSGGEYSFTGTIYGTLPMCGIDFEEGFGSPTGRGQFDCVVEYAKFDSNVTAGVALHFGTIAAKVQRCNFIGTGLFSVPDPDNLCINHDILYNDLFNAGITAAGGGELLEGNTIRGDGSKQYQSLVVSDANGSYLSGKSRRAVVRGNSVRNDLSSAPTSLAGYYGRIISTAPGARWEDNKAVNIFAAGFANPTALLVTGADTEFIDFEMSFDRTDFASVGQINAVRSTFKEYRGNSFASQYLAAAGSTTLGMGRRSVVGDKFYAQKTIHLETTTTNSAIDIQWEAFAGTATTVLRMTYTQQTQERAAAGIQEEMIYVVSPGGVYTTSRKTGFKFGTPERGIGFTDAYLKGGRNCITARVPDGATKPTGFLMVEMFAPATIQLDKFTISAPYEYDPVAALTFKIPYAGGLRGTTANRPTVTATGYTEIQAGADYIDLSIGKPIWYLGGWKDSSGAAV